MKRCGLPTPEQASRRLEEIKAEAEAIGARNKERAESIEADLARLRELVKELEE